MGQLNEIFNLCKKHIKREFIKDEMRKQIEINEKELKNIWYITIL